MKKSISAINAKGILIEWFDVLGDARDLNPVVSSIERDREDYAQRPGFIRKLLPIVNDVVTGANYSGGSYLFDTPENAHVHHHWSTVERQIDGVAFPDQPWVASFGGFVGEVVGAVDVDLDLDHHAMKRIVVWKVAPGEVRAVASEFWARLLAVLETQHMVSAWLGIDEVANTLGLVLVCSREANRATNEYAAFDFLRSLPLFEEAAPPTEQLVIDRCMCVFTIWLPPKDGQPSLGLWPNSPPLPAAAYHRGA